jgi:acyl-coenzyme A thioesterase PaaI-like protein
MNKQPNSDYCFVCGRKNPNGLYMPFYDDGEKSVFSTYTVPAVFQGYPGLVHGGIVAAMLDEVVGRVAMIGDSHHFMMSVKLEVKYRHPVPTETPLQIMGRIDRLRGRLGKAVGEIVLPDGTVAAEAAMTLADVPEELLANADLEALGWYIDEEAL